MEHPVRCFWQVDRCREIRGGKVVTKVEKKSRVCLQSNCSPGMPLISNPKHSHWGKFGKKPLFENRPPGRSDNASS